jgi:asparagine synthase (glutamine-hydrolysing)
MPGIFGLITKKPRGEAEAELLQMSQALRSEPFYARGTWVDESLGVYVGWTALKESFSGSMPLGNERGDIAMVFSGEDYPDPDIAHRLKAGGHRFDGSGPSYLVHLYEEDRLFPGCLNGMFHGLVADRIRGAVTVFNDRYGMHRLFYHEAKDAFYFAVEAKAILAVRPELRTPDFKSLGEFVAYSCVLEDRTIFRSIHSLPAASVWLFRGGNIEKKGAYFQPQEWEQQAPLEPEAFYCELRDVLSRNLPRYFAGRERMGIALTGGLDTRVIMACRQSPPGGLPSYTFGGMFRDSQDVVVARRVAQECRQTYQVITVGRDFLKNFPSYAERSVYLTEGSLDVYRASDLYVSEKAREIAPAKIVGTYGSEILRRAVMFKPMPVPPGLFRPDFASQVDQAGDTYRRLRRQHPVTFAAFRQSPWYHHGILALEQSQLTVRSPYLDNDFVRTVFRAPESAATNGDVRLRLISGGNPALARLRSDRGVGGQASPLYAALLRGVLEFTFKAEYAYDYGMPQWLTRTDHLFSWFHFERLFLGRHKFLHFRLWYRDALAAYVRQMLLDPATLSRPYVQRKKVEEIVRGHLRGERNYTTSIHKLLTLELLQRLFFDAR